MITVNEAFSKLHQNIGKNSKIAFVSAMLAGLLTHMSALTSDFPNHDGLASQYFDQNMITSGRWFLGTACSVTSYFSLPWLIGILSVFYIALACMALVKILKIKNPVFTALISILVAVFPSLASNFAYVFTMDGYMLGMLLCVLAVLVTSSDRRSSWIFGAVLLAFGMGCYQSYICIAMILSFYKVIEYLFIDDTLKNKLGYALKYLGMGAAGVGLYYLLLKVLLYIQGKTLDTYQGINGMSSGNGVGLPGTIKLMYTDFITFSTGKVVLPNIAVAIFLAIVFIVAGILLIGKAFKSGNLKKPLFYIAFAASLILIPCLMNAILIISADVTYHVLMRYQWAFLISVLIAVIDHNVDDAGLFGTIAGWLCAVSLLVISFSYVVTDNIAYSNLQKKYEKTYSYCLRLADRIEQTEGYYSGIPIAMVGVVGNDSYPVTDVTDKITGALLGVSGDYLLYKSENYADFYKYYMGISFNMLSSDEVVNFYNEDFYAGMESFPGETSVLYHDGVIYVKTENIR